MGFLGRTPRKSPINSIIGLFRADPQKTPYKSIKKGPKTRARLNPAPPIGGVPPIARGSKFQFLVVPTPRKLQLKTPYGAKCRCEQKNRVFPPIKPRFWLSTLVEPKMLSSDQRTPPLRSRKQFFASTRVDSQNRCFIKRNTLHEWFRIGSQAIFWPLRIELSGRDWKNAWERFPDISFPTIKCIRRGFIVGKPIKRPPNAVVYAVKRRKRPSQRDWRPIGPQLDPIGHFLSIGGPDWGFNYIKLYKNYIKFNNWTNLIEKKHISIKFADWMHWID